MRRKWKILLIAIFMFPMVAFFPACGCNNTETTTSSQTNNTYTVHFYTGTEESYNIPNQIINHGGLVRKPEDPTRLNHFFVGWYTDINKTILWDFETHTVTHDMTLYAKWQERTFS